MKKERVLWIVLWVLLVSCANKTVITTPTQEIPVTQEETVSTPQATSASTQPGLISPVPITSQKAEIKHTPKQGLPNSSAQQPETIEGTISPEKLLQKARSAQSLQTPAADTPVFAGEDLIPLEGRRLSPFAYEPLLTNETQTAPWKGESLKYGVYYSFIKAGTAYIKNRGITTVNGRKAFLIQTTAFSASVIDAFFKVRDVNYSWLDVENLSSLGYAQSLREGSYKRDEWLTFDYSHHTYYGEVQKKKEPRMISGKLEQPVLDMLTSLYYVRGQHLEPGKDIVFDIINREKQYPLVVKVLGRERVKTPAGTFNCVLVEPQFRGEGIFVSKGKSLQVWLTDDEYKMPVKMKTEVFIGSVSAELLEYKRN